MRQRIETTKDTGAPIANSSLVERGSTRVLRLRQLTAIVGLGRSSIYRKIQEGTFPSPIKLGCARASGWLSTEVFAWIDEQVRRTRENIPREPPRQR